MFPTVKLLKSALVTVLIVALLSACSTFQPPDVNGPRANARPYPVILTMDETKPTGLLAWKNLAQLYGVTSSEQPQFNSTTGTLIALPPTASGQLTLPRVGNGPTQTEEEIRESLRRFINDWREVIGADPSQLSLVERTDEPSGLKVATYKQRPFRNELRGEFGNLRIRFGGDRRVTELSSNCIPNAERLQTSLAAVSAKVTAEEAAAHVAGHPIPLPNSSGQSQTITLSTADKLEVKELVIYALPSPDRRSVELHLAWEIVTSNAAIKTIYLDAVTDEVIFVS